MRSRAKWGLVLLGAVVASAAFGAACGDSGGDSSTFDNGANDGGPQVDLDAYYPPFGDAGSGDGAATSGLTITPPDQTIDDPPTSTQKFQAFEKGNPTAITANWSVDSPLIGSIDPTGLFTATGNVGGVVTIFAENAKRTGQTTLTVKIHKSDVPANFDPAILAALKAGGTSDASFKWLYPYDQTVFPKGLLAPRLQWSGTKPLWIYVKATTKNLDYEGVFAPTNNDAVAGDPSQLDLPQAAWDSISLSAGTSDPVAISVTKYVAASQVTGPISETWTIAQGALKGIVYYNSYDSPLAAGDAGAVIPGDNDMGAVMRIKPGASSPEVFIGGQAKGSCTVCHTVSANGSTMAVAAGHQYDAIYGISADASAPQGPISQQPDNKYSFGALTPDGKYLVSCGSTGLDGGASADGGPLAFDDFGPNVVSMTVEQSSQLLDTSDGGVVVASLPGVQKAMMPAFSPDGTKLVFNRFVAGQDSTLSVMPFDEASHTFGTYTDVFVDPGYFLGWPSYLPDSANFVFATSDSSDQYSSYDPISYDDANGELFVYFSKINDVHHLRAAMGTLEGATPNMYLLNPDGSPASQDITKNYEPTALPVAAGGYYWVVFTSRRSYGNTIDNSNPNATPNTVKPKKLWVSAIDIGADPSKDPSHPAFYLPGQELGAGNLRGFWALEPCKGDGATCASGTECCDGFCRQVSNDAGGTDFVCVVPPATCSNEDEKCKVDSDCCGAPQNGIRCIGGYCARPTPK